MTKTLDSGLIVDDKQYYQLLEWKDSNNSKFNWACEEYQIKTKSINLMSKSQYEFLLSVANIT